MAVTKQEEHRLNFLSDVNLKPRKKMNFYVSFVVCCTGDKGQRQFDFGAYRLCIKWAL